MGTAAGLIIGAVVSAVGTGIQIDASNKQAKSQEYAAEFNADNKRKQAKYNEDVAAENMRRNRIDDKKKLGRRRANAASLGLNETQSVADNLGEEAGRLETVNVDMWNRTMAQSTYLENGAQMDLYNGEQLAAGSRAEAWAAGLRGAASVSASLGNSYTPRIGLGDGPAQHTQQTGITYAK